MSDKWQTPRAPTTPSSSPRRWTGLPAQPGGDPAHSPPPQRRLAIGSARRHSVSRPREGRSCGRCGWLEGATYQGGGAGPGWGVRTAPANGWEYGRAPVSGRGPPPPGGEESVALGPRGRGGAGQRGRHEDSGFRHVLRVPHARSVTPAPHVRATTLVTTFAACPSWPPHPPRPAARCWRPQGDVGGRVPLPGSRAAEPVA